LIIFKITAFIIWVNLLPPLASLFLGDRFSRPLDHDRLWLDKQPVLGRHKTIRGILASIVGGVAAFPLLGVSPQVAGTAAFLAMGGDLLSSFIKRRFSFPSGKDVVLLDQIFEALLPALYLGYYLQADIWQVSIVLILFVPLAHLGASFWRFLTYRPPIDNYPRIIRSTVRLREWRSCHAPLARWQVFLKLSSFLSYHIFYTWIFKLAGMEEKGKANALDMRVENISLNFPDLPSGFDGYTILLLTDLHLDGLEGLTNRIIKRIRGLEADLCLIGGDIRMETYGPMAPCLRRLRRLLSHVRTRHGVFGVLGNHDCIEMTPDFEESGLVMLINDSWELHNNGSSIWLAGVDDPHYYRVDDARQAFKGIPENKFVIFLAHSPEAYKSAALCNARLYLCGHTHGGQICLPGRGPIVTNSRAPRFTAMGIWQYGNMTGYTSRGAGASGVPLRFNCPGEISLITLRKGPETDG